MAKSAARRLPLIPTRELVVFPGMMIPLQIGRRASLAALDAAIGDSHELVLVAQREANQERIGSLEDLHATGTLVTVAQVVTSDDSSTVRAILTGIARVSISELAMEDGYLSVTATPIATPAVAMTPEVDALIETVRESLYEYAEGGSPLTADAIETGLKTEDPSALADFIGYTPDLTVEQRVELLAEGDPIKRLRLAAEHLARLREADKIKRKIQAGMREEMEKHQREFLLREQLRTIQKELGEEDPGAAEIDALRERVSASKMPDEIKARATKELDRMSRIPAMSPEVAVIRNYVDWLVDLPWGIHTEDKLDLAASEQILDDDHYGLEKVKERILEYLAVRKLSSQVRSPILCFAGPPGVGKTSLGKSIARAMGREFVRISLGGLHDEAEIRGHRRTYVGALPGRIIQGLKTAKTANPVFLLDEIDKLGRDFRGDPSSALLEVLDPEQNSTFTDNYLEVPFDLSQVLFIATANMLETIPGPLRDRMEIIPIAGYTEREKLAIARKYLVEKQAKAHALDPERVVIGDEVLMELIRRYTKEAGVRSLEREIATLTRKLARKAADTPKSKAKLRVTPADLDPRLGAARFDYGVLDLDGRPGAATGLVVSEAGGDVITLESSVTEGKRELVLTGQLGDVMRESATAALSWIEAHAVELGIERSAFEQRIHLHVPAGAIPKDGPSAGITIATTLVSLLTGRPVRRDLAMTGEITLRGMVLPIGGLKSKVLAAHLAGAKTVLFPKRNVPDLRDIPDEVKRSIELIPVERIEEVLAIALAPEPKRPATKPVRVKGSSASV
jgi:ATP-dependent Lon protease